MMIWRAVLKVLVPLGFVWAIVWCQAPAAALNGGIDGYKTIVDRVLIGQRIIRTTNAVAGLPGDAITSAAPLVKVDEARLAQTDLDGVRGAVRIFLKRSAILGEIARNDPARWKIDNSLIELNNPTGKFLSPFAYTEWTGQLLFAGARPAGRWAVRVGTGDWQPIEALQDEALAGWQASRCNSGCQFELSRHTALKPAGELRLTLNDASWSGGSPTFCGSNSQVPAEAGAQGIKGICLQIQDGDQPGLQLIYLTASRVISPDSDAQPGMRLANLASSVRSARSSWVQMGCGGNCAEVRNAPIKTTLDRELTLLAQNALDQVYDMKSRPMQRPAGITILDAETGSILALASRYRQAEDTAAEPRVGEDVNFTDLPIGSVAKPLIASAIFLDRSPQHHPGAQSWDGLQINQAQASPAVRSLLGVALESPFNGHAVAGGEWLDVGNFIKHSSNYYAGALMMLACNSRRGPPRDWDAAPWIRGAGGARPCTRDAAETEFTLPWLGAFADSYGPITPTGRIRLWGQNADANAFMPNPALFSWIEQDRQGVRPAKGIVLKSFRLNVLPMILGGQEYRWSSILVAQSFARLVTGRKVSAGLTAAGGKPGNVTIGNRAALLGGLAGVTDGGTADQLHGAFAGYLVYAKTGTPEIEEVGDSAPRQNREIRENYDAVARLIPPALKPVEGWQVFDAGGVHYRMFGGRIVSASGTATRTYFAKTFVFFVCRPEPGAIREGVDSCGGRRLVVYITTQDPYEENGYNPALGIAAKLLRRETPQDQLRIFQLAERNQ